MNRLRKAMCRCGDRRGSRARQPHMAPRVCQARRRRDPSSTIFGGTNASGRARRRPPVRRRRPGWSTEIKQPADAVPFASYARSQPRGGRANRRCGRPEAIRTAGRRRSSKARICNQHPVVDPLSPHRTNWRRNAAQVQLARRLHLSPPPFKGDGGGGENRSNGRLCFQLVRRLAQFRQPGWKRPKRGPPPKTRPLVGTVPTSNRDSRGARTTEFLSKYRFRHTGLFSPNWSTATRPVNGRDVVPSKSSGLHLARQSRAEGFWVVPNSSVAIPGESRALRISPIATLLACAPGAYGTP